MAVSGITVSGTPPRLSSPKTIPPDVNESTLEDLEANTIPRMDAGISMRDPKAKYKRFDLWNWIRIDPGKITRFRIESRRYWGTLFAIKNNFRSYIVFIILIRLKFGIFVKIFFSQKRSKRKNLLAIRLIPSLETVASSCATLRPSRYALWSSFFSSYSARRSFKIFDPGIPGTTLSCDSSIIGWWE